MKFDEIIAFHWRTVQEGELDLMRQHAWVRHMEHGDYDCCTFEPAYGCPAIHDQKHTEAMRYGDQLILWYCSFIMFYYVLLTWLVGLVGLNRVE